MQKLLGMYVKVYHVRGEGKKHPFQKFWLAGRKTSWKCMHDLGLTKNMDISRARVVLICYTLLFRCTTPWLMENSNFAMIEPLLKFQKILVLLTCSNACEIFVTKNFEVTTATKKILWNLFFGNDRLILSLFNFFCLHQISNH